MKNNFLADKNNHENNSLNTNISETHNYDNEINNEAS